MKKVFSVIAILVISLLFATGCKKEEAKVEKPVPAIQTQEKAQTAEGTVNAEENCGKAYDFMKAFVDQIEQQMAKQGKQIPNKKEFPPKDKFIKACKELPKEIIICLDMEYSMKHQQECQEAKKNADPEKMKKFEEMLK